MPLGGVGHVIEQPQDGIVALALQEQGMLGHLTLEYLLENDACVLGTPDDCLAACRKYEAAGVDLLLCLVNPLKVPHDAVMQTIELMGKEVIPQFR